MIIDLTKYFKSLRRANELKLKNDIHDLYLNNYLNIKKEISSSDFNKSLLFKFGKHLSYVEEDDWCPVISLSNYIYDISLEQDKHQSIREYISKVGNSLKTPPREVNEYIVVYFPKAKKNFFYILTEIERYMIMISEFREEYSKKINDSEYLFKSYLDFLLTADYLKLGMLEDFILEQGCFANDTVDNF